MISIKTGPSKLFSRRLLVRSAGLDAGLELLCPGLLSEKKMVASGSVFRGQDQLVFGENLQLLFKPLQRAVIFHVGGLRVDTKVVLFNCFESHRLALVVSTTSKLGPGTSTCTSTSSVDGQMCILCILIILKNPLAGLAL